MYLERCCNCGRFVGYTNYVVSAPYGGPLDIDPPGHEYLCLRCWDGMSEAGRELHYRVSYLKPLVVRADGEERYVPK